MKNFEIITDSASDLPYEYILKNEIKYINMTFSCDSKEYIDDFSKTLSYEDFYNSMKNGEVIKTSQPSSEKFYEIFKRIIEEGKDVIYICVSSGLSGTLNSANIARNTLLEEYENIKISIIDSLNGSMGQGLVLMEAIEMKKNGMVFDEVVEKIQSNIQKNNTFMIVDDLNYLKRGGRISQTAAIIGIVLHIKPVLTLNHEGRVIPVIKVRGRKKAVEALADVVFNRIENPKEQIIAISHGNCIEEAMKLKESILNIVEVKDIIITTIGASVGAYGGPSAIAVFFRGKERHQHLIG